MRIRAARWGIVVCFIAQTRAEPASFRYRSYPHPDFSVHSIEQGPRGDLWLAGPDGLHRFDGIRFTKLQQFPFSSAYGLAKSPDGTMWIGSREGLVRYRDRFEMVGREPVIGLAAARGSVFVRTDQRFFRLTADGMTTPIEPLADSLLHTDAQGDLWFVGPKGGYRLREGARVAELVAELPTDKVQQVHQFLPGKGGEGWYGRRNRGFAHRSDRRLSRSAGVKGPESQSLVAGRDGQVWYLGDTLQGLDPAVEFAIHPSGAQTAVGAYRTGYADARGRIWLESDDRELVEVVPEHGWERWNLDEVGGKPVRNVARESAGTMIACSDAGLVRLDQAQNKWTKLAAPSGDCLQALPLPDGSILAATRGAEGGLLHLSRSGSVLQRLEGIAEGKSARDEHRELVRDSKGRIWVGSARALFRLQIKRGGFTMEEVRLPADAEALKNQGPLNVVDLEVDVQGQLWAAYASGIAWLDKNDQWHRITADRPFERPLSFALSPASDEIWGSSRSHRAFFHLNLQGGKWRTEEFEFFQGYGPQLLTAVKRDRRGWIWRGTNDGVYLSDGKNLGEDYWLHLSRDHGSSVQYVYHHGFLEDADGSVWVAGDGVTHFTPRPEWFLAPANAAAPSLSVVQVNDSAKSPDNQLPADLAGPVWRLRIEVASLETAPFREEPFVYRLLPGNQNWKSATKSIVELRDLAPKEYRLEVAYASIAPVTATVYAFRVQPTLSQWPWPWILGGFAGSAFGAWSLRKSLWAQRAHYYLARTVHRARLRGRRKAVSAEERIDRVVGGFYRLERVIAVGGFSTVYEASDSRNIANRVAVKMLRAVEGEMSGPKQRFSQEVAALRTISHPGVIGLLDSWIESEGQPCLVTPFVDAPTLRALMDSTPLTASRVVRIVAKVGEALEAIHSRGIVHRDLKPENLLIRSDESGEQPILIDFGNAGLLGREEGVARTKLLAGSVFYMAPEQFSMHYAPSSDLYSFGILILEMLTGKRLADLACATASSGFAEELLLTLRSAGVGNPEPVAAKLSEVFAPDPSKRPASAAIWTQDLTSLLSTKPRTE